MLKDLNVKCNIPVNIYCDNEGAIKLSVNPVFHERTKHIEIDIHFVREKVLDGVVKVVQTSSKEQLADIFTKALTSAQHSCMCKNLKLCDPFQNSDWGRVLK